MAQLRVTPEQLHGRASEYRAQGEQVEGVIAKLDSLISGVDDIRVEMRSMRESIGDHGERLATVEARAASNSHRLDALEGKRTEKREENHND